MKKLISIAIILVTVFALMIPAFASAGAAAVKQEMWVNCENGKSLNLRKNPRTDSTIIARLECGTKVEILRNTGNGWLEVSTGKNTGYVMAKFLVAKKPGKYEITERDDNFVTLKNPCNMSAVALNNRTKDSVGLRTKPNKTSAAIRRLEAGDVLKVIARGKVWSMVVDLKTGKTGYVANDYMMAI